MKKTSWHVLIVATIGVLLAGCYGTKNPVESTSLSDKETSGDFGMDAVQGLIPTKITLAGFEVQYTGRTVGSGFTTFSYLVTNLADDMDDMHFRLELPSCAPMFSALSPSNGTTTNNDPNINPGVEWHPSTGTGPYAFSITYPGSVREGIVLVSVKSGSTTDVGQIPGACARVFDISGTVFTDANNNGAFDGGETGISNVTVNLLNSSSTAITNSNGFYIFEAIPAGNYTIQVNQNTLPSNIYLAATNPNPPNQSVSIGPNSIGNNFGFAPNAKKLINDLKFGTLTTTGKSASYWKKQFQAAVNRKGTADVSRDTLLTYVIYIRGLLLPNPFTLPNGDGLNDALNILSNPTKTDLATLNQQLLAAELNYRARFGIDPTLQLVLLGWGESLVQSNSATSAVVSGKSTADMAVIAATTLSEAVDLFTALNSSGGGSGGGGPR